LIEQRRAAPAEGPLAVRKAELEGALGAERAAAERLRREALEARAKVAQLRAQLDADLVLLPAAERLAAALDGAASAVQDSFAAIEVELETDRAAGERMARELRECAALEAEIQSGLRAAGEAVTAAEVAAQRLRDQAEDARLELETVAERLQLPVPPTPAAEPAERDGEGQEQPRGRLTEAETDALRTRVERLGRRREQLGPVNPLAKEEYAEAIAHVEEMEGRREDLETALRELRGVIRETDRQIQETFQETFEAAARNFEELVGDVFPGGSGKLRLVSEEQPVRGVLGGQSPSDSAGKAENVQPIGSAAAASQSAQERAEAAEEAAEQEAEREEQSEEDLLGVEIEITPAGKSSKRLSLLSGGEKSMTALAFMFAVFLARPCPFYILDEVEAALDDLNLDRFLVLLRRYADRAQFIVITHQKRTMEAADYLFGVSMGGDGVSKVLSRRLPSERTEESGQSAQDVVERAPEVAEVA
jgi:chromosome segregation protein